MLGRLVKCLEELLVDLQRSEALNLMADVVFCIVCVLYSLCSVWYVFCIVCVLYSLCSAL